VPRDGARRRRSSRAPKHAARVKKSRGAVFRRAFFKIFSRENFFERALSREFFARGARALRAVARNMCTSRKQRFLRVILHFSKSRARRAAHVDTVCGTPRRAARRAAPRARYRVFPVESARIYLQNPRNCLL
jgi:hypothetical protein